MATIKRVPDGAGDTGIVSQAIRLVDNNTIEVVSNRPTIGCRHLVGSRNARTYSNQDYWVTSTVTEIIEERDDYVKFNTNNSVYEWWP
jgi:hypothetical protein